MIWLLKVFDVRTRHISAATERVDPFHMARSDPEIAVLGWKSARYPHVAGGEGI